MTRICSALLLVCLLLAPATAQDAVKVAPAVYKVLAEDTRVRVLEVTLAPGAETRLHSHPAAIAVILKPSQLEWTAKDGKVVRAPDTTRGSVILNSKATHSTRNIGGQTLHVVLIEFKQPAPSNPKKITPLKGFATVVLDTPYALAFRSKIGPGQTLPFHNHNARIVIPLVSGRAREVLSTGKVRELSGKGPAAKLVGPIRHSVTNLGRAPSEQIEVELK